MRKPNLEETDLYRFGYTRVYLGYNNLGQKGCKLLTQIDWTDLECLYLGKILMNTGNNQINDSGVSHLMKRKWISIKSFRLCILHTKYRR